MRKFFGDIVQNLVGPNKIAATARYGSTSSPSFQPYIRQLGEIVLVLKNKNALLNHVVILILLFQVPREKRLISVNKVNDNQEEQDKR